MEDSGRVIVYLLWALGCVLFWGIVLAGDVRAMRAFGGSRARRELIVDSALFATAFFAAVALLLALVFGPGTDDSRSFVLALALGGFLAAGVIKAAPRRNGI